VSRSKVKNRFFDEESGMYMVTVEGFSSWGKTTMPEILWRFMEGCARLGGHLSGNLATDRERWGEVVRSAEFTCTLPAPRRVSVRVSGDSLDVMVGREILASGNSDEIRMICRGCDTRGDFKLVGLKKSLDAGMEGSKHARKVGVRVSRGFVEVKL